MSRPDPTAKGTSQLPLKIKTNKPATIEQNVLLSPNKNLHSLKKIEAVLLKNNEQTPKTTALSQSTPNKNNNNNQKGQTEKKTIKMLPVSNIEIQPVQQIPKAQSSANTPRAQVKNLPKLQMTKKNEASNTKTQKLQAKEHSATSQQSKKSSSLPLSNEKPNSSNVPVPVSISNETSTNQLSTNVQSKMKISPATKQKNLSVNTSKDSTKNNNKLDPKTVTSKKDKSGLKEENKQITKEKQSRQFLSNVETTEREKRELNNRKKRSKKNSRAIDPDDFDLRVLNTYIADGLKEDCEILVEKCLKVYKLNFEKFCEFWKQMNFPSMFNERQSSAELAELSEEAIHVAKVHMVAKNVNLEENIAGLFLVYAILNHQPYKDFAALRLIPADVPAIKHLETEARKQRRHDVLYILGNVLIKGPCQFHVLAREVALEMPIRKYFDGSIQISGPNFESVFSKADECVQTLKNLDSIDQKYSAIRQKLRERHGGPGKAPSLCTQPAAGLFNLFKCNVPGGMTCERRIGSALTKSKAPVQEEDRHNHVKSIKDRAMAKIVNPMRHLTGIDERHDKSFSPEKGEPEVESRPRTQHKSKVKRKSKGRRGRGSAKYLQELFCTDDDEEDEVVAEEEVLPQTSQKEMPIIDTTGDLITVTDLELLPPKKLPSLSSPNNNETLSKVELVMSKNEMEYYTNKDHVSGQARNLETNSSKTEAKDKKVNKPAKKGGKTKKKQEHKLFADLDFDKIDNSPLDIFLHEKPVIETKLDKTNKSHNNVLGMSKKVKNNAKHRKINGLNSKELHFHEQDINIDLDSMPVEMHTANENIEIEIIDDFNGGVRTLERDEETKEKDANREETDESIDICTDSINARFLQKKRKELKRMKTKLANTQETNESGESGSNKDTNASEIMFQVPDTSFPSTEKLEARLNKKKTRDPNRVRIKSKLKRMGILEIANLNYSEGEDSSSGLD